MSRQYVEKVDGVYRLAGTRVSLDSVVHGFWRGETAESIAQSFPVLTLEQVYGALTFYLANKSDIDAYLEKADEEFERLRQDARNKDPMFYKKLVEKPDPFIRYAIIASRYDRFDHVPRVTERRVQRVVAPSRSFALPD